MKSKLDVSIRLNKLIKRYRKRYIESHLDKTPDNCKYNYEHIGFTSESTKSWDTAISPRVQTSLIVIYPQKPVRLCTYGSESPSDWSGTVCDNDDVSRPCSFFIPTASYESLSRQFDELMLDDKFVLENYPDVAALQWVHESRWPGVSAFMLRVRVLMRTVKTRMLTNGYRKGFGLRGLFSKK